MGDELVKQIADATGLPSDLVQGELARLFEAAGMQTGAATLEDVRTVLSEYVQDVLVQAKEELAKAAS